MAAELSLGYENRYDWEDDPVGTGGRALKSCLAGVLIILGAMFFMASIALFVFGTESVELLPEELQIQIGVLLRDFDPTLAGIGALAAGVVIMGWGLAMITST